jgi:hypothetical protein
MSVEGEWKYNEIKNTVILTDTEIDNLQLHNRHGVTNRLTQFYYVLSIPIYDKTKNYAVIRFGGGSARNNMVGSYFLLKREKNKWIILTSFASWAA